MAFPSILHLKYGVKKREGWKERGVGVRSTHGNGSLPGESYRSAGETVHGDGGGHIPEVHRPLIGGLLVLKSPLYFICKSYKFKMKGFQGESGA